ncbi:MAG: hypothetical protein ACHQFZ_03610 [Acidimicrobiales bacterium]
MILRRLLRLALRASVLRAWTQRSGRWLLVAGGVALLRLAHRVSGRSRATTGRDPA